MRFADELNSLVHRIDLVRSYLVYFTITTMREEAAR